MSIKSKMYQSKVVNPLESDIQDIKLNIFNLSTKLNQR